MVRHMCGSVPRRVGEGQTVATVPRQVYYDINHGKNRSSAKTTQAHL